MRHSSESESVSGHGQLILLHSYRCRSKVGFESPPLVLEDSNKIPTYVEFGIIYTLIFLLKSLQHM